MTEFKAFGEFSTAQGIDAAAVRGFYEDHLFEVLLPFWLRESVDREAGGYFVAFTNAGDHLVSEDKFTWSIGRMVWMFAHLAELPRLRHRSPDRQDCLDLAALGADFLMEHCLLPNGNCAFLMDRWGRPKEPTTGAGYDISFYADCFVADGLARYAAASGRRDALLFAMRVYDSIRERYLRYDLRTEPYPIPEGWRAHAVEMIQLKVSQELARALDVFGDPRSNALREHANGFMDRTLGSFLQPDGLVREFIGIDGEARSDCALGRYVEPGHGIEDAWFMIHHARANDREEDIERVVDIVERSMSVGWDEEHGGLLRYLDCEGGKPRDPDAQDRSAMAEKLRNEWDVKLWWTHSEALYSSLLAWRLTGRPSLIEWYGRLHDYTFRTFPNPNRDVGEWIQIRDRQGRPANVRVALPVKDPFHVIRNMMLVIELLGR